MASGSFDNASPRRSRTKSIGFLEDDLVQETKVDSIETRPSKTSRKSSLIEKPKNSISISDQVLVTEKKCKPIQQDEYDIDFSMLKGLPRSVILDAIEYAKQKRKEEEEKELELEAYKHLKCVPPWAKSYGGQRLETCVAAGTQYEEPSYLRLPKVDRLEWGEEIEEEILQYDFDEYRDKISKAKKKDKKRLEDKDKEDSDEYLYDEGRKQRKGDKRDEDEAMSTVSSKSGKTVASVSIQFQPETRPFGMQTGRDSLTVVDTHLRESQLAALSSDERLRVLAAQGMLTPEQLAALTPEQLAALTPEKLAAASEEERRALLSKMTPEERLALDFEERFLKSELLGAEQQMLEGEFQEGLELEQLPERESVKAEGEYEGAEYMGGIKLKTPSKDVDYLKHHLGHILPKILAEIAWKQPKDPVHYLAHRLYHERRHQEIHEQMICMRAALKHEREMLMAGDAADPIKTFGFVDRDRGKLKITDEYDKLEYLEEEERLEGVEDIEQSHEGVQ